ncbi:MAG TPA: hypothetical protein VF887_09940 [Gemmatimonadaceae bacterium]
MFSEAVGAAEVGVGGAGFFAGAFLVGRDVDFLVRLWASKGVAPATMAARVIEEISVSNRIAMIVSERAARIR